MHVFNSLEFRSAHQERAHQERAQLMSREFVVTKNWVLIQIGRQFKVKCNTRSHVIHLPMENLIESNSNEGFESMGFPQF